ncbi:MAG: TrmH family RNA methyltransferase [Spirochaetales bacterium]|nr:TrmH family RNA methyltransferase [Spirochaetales bacterium]
MITARKLSLLSPGVQKRKLVALWSEWQRLNETRQTEESESYRDLAIFTRSLLRAPFDNQPPTAHEVRIWRRALLDNLGLSEADWDLQAPPDRRDTPLKSFPFTAFLEDLRSSFNVGSIFRTAEAYGWQRLVLSSTTPSPSHPRTQRSAMGTQELLAWSQNDLATFQAIWDRQPVFALELGGTPVEDFKFPQDETGAPLAAVVLVGNEELGLSQEALAWADASWGRVSLPLYGRKASLNVGVAFGVLASCWTARFAGWVS